MIVCHSSYAPCSSAPHTDPAYLSGGDLCAASDVYSLGVILLQLLTGRPVADGLVEEVQALVKASGGLPTRRPKERGGSLEMSRTQATALTDLLDPTAGPWPIGNASGLLRVALTCTEARQRHRPDLKFHVIPRLAALCREATCMMRSVTPLPGRTSSGDRETLRGHQPGKAMSTTSEPGKAMSTTSEPGKAMSTTSEMGKAMSTNGDLPAVFHCPITRELMADPVVVSYLEDSMWIGIPGMWDLHGAEGKHEGEKGGWEGEQRTSYVAISELRLWPARTVLAVYCGVSKPGREISWMNWTAE